MNERNDIVIVVTVTYNSSDYLKRLINSLADSSYSVEKIIVVDNNSEEKHKKNIEQMASEWKQIDILRQEQNLGGAGGFEKGVEYAVKEYSNADWIWVMDDDAFPSRDCLEKLLNHADLPYLGCLSPMIYGVELQDFQYYHPKNASKFLDSHTAVTTDINTQEELTSIEMNAFVGPLIKMSVVKDVGIPDGQLFIYGDDREYTYRITRKYKMYLVKSAVINHRDEVMSDGFVNPKGIWKEYYHYRNNGLFIQKYKRNKFQGMIGKVLLVKDVIRATLSTLKHSRYKKYRLIRIKCVWKGFWDGIYGITGKTIDPKLFNELYIERKNNE